MFFLEEEGRRHATKRSKFTKFMEEEENLTNNRNSYCPCGCNGNPDECIYERYKHNSLEQD